ncbi:endonuclease/exonuclease/phosphatase family protein [Pseudorhodobacter ferrugineus]|uniref:endonuclease/exonuclease/phosphatase family protein n=1 Tax=Pseudorhodobacter ferrugineus TaxID=77008 RepID=UPI0003B7BB94|nr:endonuclease/exonuclease/phosphatase family protein [Pseudorhodobacter ferrugineus]
MANVPPDPPPKKLRLATYNVEWFNGLFDDAGRLMGDNGRSARYGITRAEQLAALGIVFTAMDADGVMIIEAPDTGSHRSTITALETFARHFGLRTTRALHGFTSETEQEIAFMYDPDRLAASHSPLGEATGTQGVPRFDGVFRHDLNVDARPERIRFSKPPLEVALHDRLTGQDVRLIGVHAKSKSPHGARNPAEVSRIAIENRRKQLAQCMWLRARVDAQLAQGEGLIVLGDFNDGPGLDEYEKLFGKSGIEIVIGADGPVDLQLMEPHAEMILGRKLGVAPTSARFYDPDKNRYFQALLDFILVSPNLAPAAPVWRIWHPMDDPDCWRIPELREALLTASDHFPVTLDLHFGA